jgi:hypothetical protein
MQGIAKNLKAFYSPLSFTWHLNLDEIEFEVRYLLLHGVDVRIQYRILNATQIEWNWEKDIFNIIKWKEAKLTDRWEIFNPDQPRSLAKTVTVK